jgi:plastocyanin
MAARVAEVTEGELTHSPFVIDDGQSLPSEGARGGPTVRTATRIWVATMLGAVLAAALAIAPVGATDSTIKVGDNFFKPKKVTVVAGDKVTWKWTGSAVHDVTATKGPKKFHSKQQSSGKYSKVLALPGTYKIVCTLHAGMKMTLVVETPPPPTTAPTAPPPPAP